MSIRLTYLISGYLSLITGAFASLSIYRLPWIKYGMGVAILGFIFSMMNIFLYTKYFSEKGKWTNGYLGLFLNSLPVLFMLFVVFRFRR
jgi:hypothetical protein